MDTVPLCEPWPVSGCAVNLTDYPGPMTGIGVMAASEILWAASGYRFGTCTITIRPCSRRCGEQPYGGWWWYPERWASSWPYGPVNGGFVEAVCGRCTTACSCTSASELRLPKPALEIEQVTIDGAVLPPSGYVLYDRHVLVRTDGEQWPFCQDWAATSGVGVFDVTARFGRPVPALGVLAMGEVLPEVLKLCKGESCALPSGVVQSTTRNGVTKVFVRSDEMAKVKRTGLPLTDRFIEAVNPKGLTYGPEIWDPQAVLEARRAPP